MTHKKANVRSRWNNLRSTIRYPIEKWVESTANSVLWPGLQMLYQRRRVAPFSNIINYTRAQTDSMFPLFYTKVRDLLQWNRSVFIITIPDKFHTTFLWFNDTSRLSTWKDWRTVNYRLVNYKNRRDSNEAQDDEIMGFRNLIFSTSRIGTDHL